MDFSEHNADQELVDRLLKGDLEAFNLIFKKYGDKLYRFALKYLRSKEEAEELVQEVFLKILENRKNLKKELSLKSYLFTISYHYLCRIFRRRNYRSEFEKEITATASDTFSIEDRLEYQSVFEQIDQIIEKLPPRRKEIFIKSRKEGKTTREIAEEMHLVPSTVDNQISEALKFIRQNICSTNFSLMLFFLIFIQ